MIIGAKEFSFIAHWLWLGRLRTAKHERTAPGLKNAYC